MNRAESIAYHPDGRFHFDPAAFGLRAWVIFRAPENLEARRKRQARYEAAHRDKRRARKRIDFMIVAR